MPWAARASASCRCRPCGMRRRLPARAGRTVSGLDLGEALGREEVEQVWLSRVPALRRVSCHDPACPSARMAASRRTVRWLRGAVRRRTAARRHADYSGCAGRAPATAASVVAAVRSRVITTICGRAKKRSGREDACRRRWRRSPWSTPFVDHARSGTSVRSPRARTSAQRPKKRHLAAVGVAGEHQVDRVRWQFLREVGLVRDEQDEVVRGRPLERGRELGVVPAAGRSLRPGGCAAPPSRSTPRCCRAAVMPASAAASMAGAGSFTSSPAWSP